LNRNWSVWTGFDLKKPAWLLFLIKTESKMITPNYFYLLAIKKIRFPSSCKSFIHLVITLKESQAWSATLERIREKIWARIDNKFIPKTPKRVKLKDQRELGGDLSKKNRKKIQGWTHSYQIYFENTTMSKLHHTRKSKHKKNQTSTHKFHNSYTNINTH